MVERYALTVFVETGCDQGDGLRFAQELGLEQRYSCDLNWTSVATCCQWGAVAREDSLAFLRRMARARTEACLFWLDAHFPATWKVKNTPEEWRFPLPEELKIITDIEGIGRSVIIADDICNIQSDDNPTRIDAVPECAVYGITIADLTNLFPRHKPVIHDIGYGVLVLEPR